MVLKDRNEAGLRLADRLKEYRRREPLVLAVPRGGVMVARPIWQQLGGDLDLIITRKIGAPHQPELAVGAVAGDGYAMFNEDLLSRLTVSKAYLEKAAETEAKEITRRLRLYRGDRPLPEVRDRLVILVDDGVATGYTLLVALRSLQQQKPQRLVLAVPVGPPDTFARLRNEVDELVYLAAPPHFNAVGQFYLDFEQVEDAAVVNILGEAWDNTR